MSVESLQLILIGCINREISSFEIWRMNPLNTFQRGSRAPGELICEHTLSNQQFDTFVTMITFFLSVCDTGNGFGATSLSNFSCACFSVAGPVNSNQVSLDNRSKWVLDEKELEEQFQIPHVHLINDFLSNGYGLLTLSRSEYITLQDAPEKPDSPIACIGACNGLGQCFIVQQDEQYWAWPSEGGHCEFAPKTELEIELLQWLKRQFSETNRVSVERVVSMTGLFDTYRFLSEKYEHMIDKEVHHNINNAVPIEKKVAYMFKYSQTDKLCHKAMEIFISTFGSEAGCAALKWLPYGGLYIAGSLALKSIHRFRSDPTFMESYYDKGRVNVMMRQIPVRVVLVEDLALRGAQLCAYKHIRAKFIKSQKYLKVNVEDIVVKCIMAAAVTIATISSLKIFLSRRG